MPSKMPDFKPSELFFYLSTLNDELRLRGFLEDRNGLTGNLAEVYFCYAHRTPRLKNEKGHDCMVGPRRVQVKGALLTTNQTGKIGGGYGGPDSTVPTPFDDMAVVVFNEDYSVYGGVVIPYEVLQKERLATWNSAIPGWIVTCTQRFWGAGRNITPELRKAAQDLENLGYVPDEYRKPRNDARGTRTSDIRPAFKPESILIPKGA